MSSSFRITNNGMLYKYRSNLNNVTKNMQRSMQRVSDGRNFSTFAEDPAAASRAFQVRRSYWRNNDSLDTTSHVMNKFETAYQAAESIVDGDAENPSLNGMLATMKGLTGTVGSGRVAMGQELVAEAESIVQLMNSRYGDEYVYGGADSMNAPFVWDGASLTYQGVDVNDTEAMEALLKNDVTYANIGLGMQENEKGLITSTAFKSSLSGAEFLGYGVDEDGDSKNLAVLVREIGEIFQRCDSDTGTYATEEDSARASALLGKITSAVGRVQEQHTDLSAKSNYLRTNEKQLETANYQLNEELSQLEDTDSALAITEMSWAVYSYQAALQIGSKLLSSTLFDYMN